MHHKGLFQSQNIMVLKSNGECKSEIEETFEPPSSVGSCETKDPVTLGISTSQRGLLDERSHRSKFLRIMNNFGWIRSGCFSNLSSPSKFQEMAREKNDISCSPHSPAVQSSSRRFLAPFSRKINWSSLWELFKKWIRQPMNIALFVWIVCVGVSGAILFLVMTGMLNGVLPKKSQRDTWFEVNNQILNALFTLMCLYQHPKRFYHLALLCRWRKDDVLSLRKIYCKHGAFKPNERKHMLVVVILLHVNCFAQYALCCLNLGYRRSRRPVIGVGLCLSVAIAAAAVAGLYNILSPLGKEYEDEADEEAQLQNGASADSVLGFKSPEKRYSFQARGDRVVEDSPQWVGGLFDFWDDISLAYLSVFCSCCVFGWNMDRLGFGNMYVHVATFLLFCLAPFFIFNLAAVNIDNEAVREALGITGFLLCIFGLLYGGFWRIQMRKKFKLPPNGFCCGKPTVTDCFHWLFCCSCSLAQEVRTADYYDIVEDKLYLKGLSPLRREDGTAMNRASATPLTDISEQYQITMENSASPNRLHEGSFSEWHVLSMVEPSAVGKDNKTMRAPVFSVIQKEDMQAR